MILLIVIPFVSQTLKNIAKKNVLLKGCTDTKRVAVEINIIINIHIHLEKNKLVHAENAERIVSVK